MDALLALLIPVNRIIEAVKRFLKEKTQLSEENQRLAVYASQLVVSIAAVFIAQSQAPVIQGTVFERFGEFYGVLLAGLTLAGGAEFIHLIIDLTGRLGKSDTTTATVTLPSDTGTKAEASVSVGANPSTYPRG